MTTCNSQSITAFTDAFPTTSSFLANEWADCSASLRDVVDRLSWPRPVPLTSRHSKIEIMGPAPKIMREVIARINELFTLPNNWDSYGGRPISFTAAMAAISWLDDYSEDKLPVPSVVPGSDGSVQLEWHIHGIDLEVLFPPSGTPEFVYEDHNTNTQQDGFLALENQDGRVFVQQIAAQTDE